MSEKRKAVARRHRLMDVPSRRFWKHVDREKLETFLLEPVHADSSGRSKYESFVLALHDPEFSHKPFPVLLREFGISLHELQSVYTDGTRQLALLALCQHAPAVLDDQGRNARNRMEVCPRCDGEKIIAVLRRGQPEEKTCPVCKGSGEVEIPGNDRAIDRVLEAAKIIKQVPLVAIQQNIQAGMGLDSSLEDLLKLTAKMTLGIRSVEPEKTHE